MDGYFINCVQNIYKIENPFLYSQYLIKKAEYESRGTVEEIMLYHCTSEIKMRLIAQSNFNYRLVKRSRFGKGISFSSSPDYANKYASKKIGCNRAMIVATVLIGRTQNGRPSFRVPPSNADTTTGNKNLVFVKYYDNEFYPLFAVSYTEKKG